MPTTITKLRVKKSSLPAVLARHPWVLASSLEPPSRPPALGDVVDLVDAEDRFLARGLYHPGSRIAVRVYTYNAEEAIDEGLIRLRLHQAVQMRRQQLKDDDVSRVGRRLVFSEADRLSGLVVDAFGPEVVIQLGAAALQQFLPLITSEIRELWPCQSVRLQIERGAADREGMQATQEILAGAELRDSKVELIENSLSFAVDVIGGQKTGHYLDQRQNRLLAAQWIEPGSRVLDVCSYSGGFACTIAANSPGTFIRAIDSSAAALELAKANAEANGLETIEFEKADFFEALQAHYDAGWRYDAIVLDPPRLAGSRASLQRALPAYHRLNYLAVRLLRTGGTLITCSCSGSVDRATFGDVLLGVSKRSRRDLQILDSRGAADDHPVLVSCPETDYLKCFICRVW